MLLKTHNGPLTSANEAAPAGRREDRTKCPRPTRKTWQGGGTKPATKSFPQTMLLIIKVVSGIQGEPGKLASP